MDSSPDNAALYRILDANFNRCQEGLRVLEEVARFRRNHARLAEEIKGFRHRLAANVPSDWLPRFQLMRSVEHDVGRELTANDEYKRADFASIANANASRVKQSLRALEEFSKPLAADTAREFEVLRYRFYAIEQAFAVQASICERLQQARLYVLVTGRESEHAFADWAQRLLDAGPDVIQLRDKRLTDRELLARGRRLRRLTADTSTLMVINDRPDIARLCDADGVHVGQDELSVEEVRRIVGPEMVIGVSTHAVEQAQQAVADGAQYLGAGPTFPSETKEFEHFPGLDYLRQLSQFGSEPVPIFAIGGIGPANLHQVLETGVLRVAVSGCVDQAADPGEAVRTLRRKLVDGTG